MAREEYQQSLTELQTAVERMSEVVLDQLDDALTAIETGDDDLAREVIDGDDAINERYLELERECIGLFARQQPVAGDLRFIAASFKILTDLERIGDLATNLAQYALANDGDRLSEVDAYGLGAQASEQVAAAIEAYATEDTDACRAIVARDDELDTACQHASEQVVRDLIEAEAGTEADDDGDPWAVERVLDDVSRVLLTVRDLERVGDHAVNIAARTLYMADNDAALIY